MTKYLGSLLVGLSQGSNLSPSGLLCDGIYVAFRFGFTISCQTNNRYTPGTTASELTSDGEDDVTQLTSTPDSLWVTSDNSFPSLLILGVAHQCFPVISQSEGLKTITVSGKEVWGPICAKNTTQRVYERCGSMTVPVICFTLSSWGGAEECDLSPSSHVL